MPILKCLQMYNQVSSQMGFNKFGEKFCENFKQMLGEF